MVQETNAYEQGGYQNRNCHSQSQSGTVTVVLGREDNRVPSLRLEEEDRHDLPEHVRLDFLILLSSKDW